MSILIYNIIVFFAILLLFEDISDIFFNFLVNRQRTTDNRLHAKEKKCHQCQIFKCIFHNHFNPLPFVFSPLSLVFSLSPSTHSLSYNFKTNNTCCDRNIQRVNVTWHWNQKMLIRTFQICFTDTIFF